MRAARTRIRAPHAYELHPPKEIEHVVFALHDGARKLLCDEEYQEAEVDNGDRSVDFLGKWPPVGNVLSEEGPESPKEDYAQDDAVVENVHSAPLEPHHVDLELSLDVHLLHRVASVIVLYPRRPDVLGACDERRFGDLFVKVSVETATAILLLVRMGWRLYARAVTKEEEHACFTARHLRHPRTEQSAGRRRAADPWCVQNRCKIAWP